MNNKINKKRGEWKIDISLFSSFMNNFEWIIYEKEKRNLYDIIKEMRGFTTDTMRAFLENNYSPMPSDSLPNIQKAKQLVLEAVKNQQNILVCGDYDADGITATATMVIGLKLLTPLVSYDIPLREEGYGLSLKMVRKAIKANVKLIITVDNGIACHEAIEFAENNGIKVIVTDHHEHVKAKLPCEVVVDPMIMKGNVFRNICGCYVALKFVRYVVDDLVTKHKDLYKQLVFLSVISTIGDSMPLFNENRTFISKVLPLIHQWDLGYGMEALIKAVKNFDKEHCTSTDIAFSIVPTINAAGRLDDPKIAVELLLADDEVVAQRLAEKLVQINDLRKKITANISSVLEVDNSRDVIVAIPQDTKHGMLGLIANKLSEAYKKPVYVLSENAKGMLSGSARSYGDYNILECITSNAELMTGGGHAFACGVKNIDKKNWDVFLDYVNNHYQIYKKNNPNAVVINEVTGEEIIAKTLQMACVLEIEDINEALLRQLDKLEPFGYANHNINFCSYNVPIQSYKVMGDDSQHIKFVINDEMEAVLFNDKEAVQYYLELGTPSHFDIAYTISKNWFMGKCRVNLYLKDFKINQ